VAKFISVSTLAVCLAGLSFAATAPRQLTLHDGLPNFHEVNQDVYRGGQPTDAGFASLAKIGVKTIIDLRKPGSRADHEKAVVESLGMHYESVPLSGLGTPDRGKLVQILRVMNTPAEGPVFVHCRRGADRTGVVLACYRISHDGWDNHRAKKEAVADGMSIFQVLKKSFIMDYHPAGNAPVMASAGATPIAALAR
jgi:tyrosine-protein phosphatase SIW14